MEKKLLKRIVLQLGVVLLIIAMVSPFAFAGGRGKWYMEDNYPEQLKIYSVDATTALLSHKIYIKGINFTEGHGTRVVELNNNPMIIRTFTDTYIEAETSPNHPPQPGDYLLTVTTGYSAFDYDEYNLTIGVVGPQGPKGDTGSAGPVGLTGPAGPQGPIGLTGPTGSIGPIGPIGPTGATGSIGPIGPTGATGSIGPIGPMGATGSIGPIGPIGATGATGATGSIGPIGPTGATGSIGPIGPIGLTGATGLQGPTGAAGAQGAIGPAGPQGETGPQGLTGAPGKDGKDGTIDRTTLQFKQCDVADTCSCDSPKVVMTYGVQCLQPGTPGDTVGSYVKFGIAYPATVPTTPGVGGITGISAYCWYEWNGASANFGPPEKIWLVCF